jgi:hypothetical protein
MPSHVCAPCTPFVSPAPPSSLVLPPLEPYAPPPLRLASSPHPCARAFLSATIHVAAPSPSFTDLAAQISCRPLLLLLRRRHSRPHPVCAWPPEKLGHESTCTCLPDHHAAAPSLSSTTLAAWIPRWPPLLLLHHNRNRPHSVCARPTVWLGCELPPASRMWAGAHASPLPTQMWCRCHLRKGSRTSSRHGELGALKVQPAPSDLCNFVPFVIC